MSKYKVGQKLYHYAYGRMTIVSITDNGRYVVTEDDYPEGFRATYDYNIGVFGENKYRSVKGRTEEELMEDPEFLGYRRTQHKSRQVWITDSIGSWLFESPDDVGKENNDWNWKKEWPAAECGSEGPLTPAVYTSREINNWHTCYFDNGYIDKTGKLKNGVVIKSPTNHDGKKFEEIAEHKVFSI